MQLKKETKERKKLGEFKRNKSGLNYYIYLKIELTNQEKDYSSSIMIIIEQVQENLHGFIVL